MTCCNPASRCRQQTDGQLASDISHRFSAAYPASISRIEVVLLPARRGISWEATISSDAGNTYYLAVVADSLVVAMTAISVLAGEYFDRGDWV